MQITINEYAVVADANRNPHYVSMERWKAYNWSSPALCGQSIFYILLINNTVMCSECQRKLSIEIQNPNQKMLLVP